MEDTELMKKPCILIVDDDIRYVEMLELTLSGQGYDILTAVSGRDAIFALNQHPDLVILDIVMPDIDGFEVADHLTTITGSSIPYIFLTAKGQPIHRLKGLGLGALDYITKPFHPNHLLNIVKEILESHKVPNSREEL